ncbi:MAG: universal stress protein [Myxococcota bacterium]
MEAVRHILVGYDGFERGEGISAAAIEIARRHNAKLHVLNVPPAEPPRGWKTAKVSSAELHAALVDSRRRRLEQLVADISEAGLETEARVRPGIAHVELIREAATVEADLIVVNDEPQHRDGRRGFGTVTAKLLRKSPIPVLAHRDAKTWHPRRIVAALDVEPSSEQDDRLNLEILQTASALAQPSGAKVVVFHAWRLWGEELLRGRTDGEELRTLLEDTEQTRRTEVERLIARAGLPKLDVEVEVQKGDAQRALIGLSDRGEMDVLVMGTLRRSGLPGFIIGNTAERIINKLGCAILALKPVDFMTPIDLPSS